MALIIILALFIGVPVVEIAVFIEVGGRIGLWPTIGIIVLTALIGTFLLRQQGLAALRRVQESLEQNRLPLAEVFDGLCLLVAGALLLTPGFVTDGIGFLLFTPPFRALLRHLLVRYWTVSGRIDIRTTGAPGGAPGGAGPTIEGDYREVDPDGEKDGDTNGGGPDRDPPSPPPQIPR